MTTETTAASGTTPAGSDIARLNPFDGLFLRAEHLQRMQSYTRARTTLLGQAGGPGVVHGYGVSLDQAADQAVLEVTPGLAFDPSGQPLLMTTPYRRPLQGFTDLPDGVWVIALKAKDVPFGDEDVYGALCDDPCSENGGSTRPYIAEQVDVRLDPVQLPGVAGSSQQHRRSRVASSWFEDERTKVAMLRPGSGGFAWGEPTGLPGGATVPVGVLLRIGGAWEVDTWIARRDRLEMPPRRAWQQRLGMRPLDVFVAQILQFQVQLVQYWPQASTAIVGLANARLALGSVDVVAEEIQARRNKAALDAVARLKQLLTGRLAAGTQGQGLLYEAGFTELPPAGYLPLSGGEWTVHDEVAAMMGPRVELRFCACRPDFVGHAIEAAQHLDRIPLTADDDQKPAVDILVPDGVSDWVAFSRRRHRDCEAPVEREQVPVCLHKVGTSQKAFDDVTERLMKGDQPHADQEAAAVFATDPGDPTGFRPLVTEPSVRGWTTGATKINVISLVPAPERRPTAAVRAALLASVLDSAAAAWFHTVVVESAAETLHVVALFSDSETPGRPS